MSVLSNGNKGHERNQSSVKPKEPPQSRRGSSGGLVESIYPSGSSEPKQVSKPRPKQEPSG